MTLGRAVASFAVLSALGACGEGPSTLAPTRSMSLMPGERKPYIWPKAMTLQIPHETVKAAGGVASLAERDAIASSGSQWTPFFTAGGAPLPVYLERRQITYTGGADNSSQNRSSVVGNGSATVGAYGGNDAQWNQIVTCVQDQFSRFNLEVTDVEPASGEYVEAHFGGTPGQVGLPNGVGGVAPIDSFSCNIIPRAVVYTFSGVLGNSPQINCEVAAQEIAHAFSLDHEFLCQDPMTYLSGCGAKTFQDTEAQCGEFEPRQCNCNRSTHNSVQIMLAKLGPSGPTTPPDPTDTIPPVVTLVSPANNATLIGGTQSAQSVIEVVADVTDAGTVVATDLIWEFNGSVFPCPTNQAAVACTRIGNRSTWSLNVGVGDRTFSVRARDSGGNETASADRTIHLTADGTPPPPPTDDDVAPSVTMVSPQNGAELLANSTIAITATATDDQGLGSVELLWTFAGEAFPCPMQAQNISCAQTGDTFTWQLNVGVGSRAFQVRATDLAGNAQVTPERTITLTTDPAPPTDTDDDDAAEPNDDATTAFGTRCGTAMDIVATPGDEDWYSIEAAAGTDVEVGLAALEGSSLALTLLRADGTTVLDESADALADTAAATSADEIVLARVTTSGALSISYRLAITCGDGDVAPPPDTDDDLEPNDDAVRATRSFCGQTREGLAALNDDVFVVNVREGDTLRALVSNDGVTATIIAENGDELTDTAVDVSAAELPAGDVWVRVAPVAGGTAYGVSLECTAALASPQPSAGCACGATTSNDTVLGLAGLAGALMWRRRRPR
jgi:MYXO-CTERM domain-containing protein